MVRFFKNNFLCGVVFFGNQLHHSEQKIPLTYKVGEKFKKTPTRSGA
jgi:hypothetical protein